MGASDPRGHPSWEGCCTHALSGIWHVREGRLESPAWRLCGAGTVFPAGPVTQPFLEAPAPGPLTLRWLMGGLGEGSPHWKDLGQEEGYPSRVVSRMYLRHRDPSPFPPQACLCSVFQDSCTSLPLLPLAQPPLPLSQVFTPSRHQTALVQVTNHPAALGPTLASCTHGPSRLFKASFSWLLVTSSLCTAPSPPLPDPPPRLRPPPCVSLSVLLVLLRSLRDLQSPYF